MRNIIKILITISFLFSFNIYAQELDSAILTTNNLGEYNNGSIRNDMENYGVHKKWKITEKNISNVMKTPYVDSSLKIYDYANILTIEEETKVKSLIDEYIEKTGMDMVFVSINMPYAIDYENEKYAADFYDYNDFGLSNKDYSGVILLRNAYEKDPYFNVYTFGEGQLYYDYDRCESMLDDIYPYFKSNSYLKGLELFISDFSNYYDSGVALENYYIDEYGQLHKDKGSFKPPYLIGGGLGAIVSIIVVIIMVKKNKMVKKAKNAADYVDNSKTNFKKKTDNFVSTFTTRTRMSSSSSGGGHGSSLGSSGGFHGGGGGRHG